MFNVRRDSSCGDSLRRCVASPAGRTITPSPLQEVSLLNRRSFLSAASGLAAALALPCRLSAQLQSAPSALPDTAFYNRDREAFGPNCASSFSFHPMKSI